MAPRPASAVRVAVLAVLASVPAAVGAIALVYHGGPVETAGGWLMLDELSAFHLGILTIVFCLASLSAPGYFSPEISSGKLSLRAARLFAALWCASLTAMELVLVSGNLGVMWVGIEATTLMTSFLVSLHVSRTSLEAMWKYLLICTVGVGIAFMGVLLIAAAAQDATGMATHRTLLWTHLLTTAPSLNPMLVKMGFLFVLVGFGTKAGLAPMHYWLPDAHSQAPAPVSALFSGFMINAPLYCIMRYMPISDAAAGAGWTGSVLRLIGVVSILVAAAFIVFQKDLKRLLAYCSVEHMGIIALGLGFGGLGTFAALFHTLNHSLAKTVAFIAAGRLGHTFGSQELDQMHGAWQRDRPWALATLVSLLALVGAAPLATFMSEFQIVTAAVHAESYWYAGLMLAGLGTAFVAMIARAIPLFFGESAGPVERIRRPVSDWLIPALPLVALVVLCVWMPDALRDMLERSTALVDGAAGMVPQGEVAMDATRGALTP